MQQANMNAIRTISFGLLVLVAVSLLTRGFSGAETHTPDTTAPKRQYYLTKETFNGNQALNACKSGYHFASFAEIMDPAVLTYNNTLGRSAADDGAGPPSAALGIGWVRSGYSSNSAPGGGVPTNCSLWTSGAEGDDGEVGIFDPGFVSGTANVQPVVGFSDSNACDNSQGYNIGVWCVQN
jgi:hypothetical protein